MTRVDFFHSINIVLTMSNTEDLKYASFRRREHEVAKQRYFTSNPTAVSEMRY